MKSPASRTLLIRLAAFVEQERELEGAAVLARKHDCRILMVGGAIRDLALGRPVVDLDFILEGKPGRFLRALSRRLGHRVVTFRKRGIVDHRIVARGREWDFVERGARTLRAEIVRRDFALNAVAYDPLSKVLYDPAAGLRDLARRRIRATGPGVFRDDPLRMLRAVRLKAELGPLAIERRTAALIKREAGLLARVSGERVKSEIDRILAAPCPSRAVIQMERLGLLRQVLPELDPLRGLTQNRYHHLDAFRHTLAALEAADDPRALARGLPPYVFAADPLEGEPGSGGAPMQPTGTARRAGSSRTHESVARSRALPKGGSQDGLAAATASSASRRAELAAGRGRLLRWALLLHDTGKAVTRTIGEDGEYHFFLHERDSARIARGALRRLRAPRAEIAAVERLVFLHLRVSIPSSGEISARALRRIVRDAGDLTPLLVLHSLADKIASHGPGHARTLARLRRAGRQLLEMWRSETARARRAPRLLDGHDVMRALGIPPGPQVGTLLEELWDLQGAGQIATREQALAWLLERNSPS